MVSGKDPIRIANCSGATGDGPLALRQVVRGGRVDVVTADYLAEVNIGEQYISSSDVQDGRI
jgi:hypothetical protein